MSLLEFGEVNKYFGDTYVLKDVDLNVEEGEVCVVIDPLGSRKSTLFRYANRLEETQGGEIRFEGQSISVADADISRLRQRTGMVFQSFNLFPHKTARGNVTLTPMKVKGLKKGDAEHCADEPFDRVGLGVQSNSYPNQLSDGQQQCVATVRVFAMDPHVMLFDEVANVLDSELVGEVFDVMYDLADEGMTMFVVTYEMGFAREVGSRVALMADGEIIEDSPSEVFFENLKTDCDEQFLSKLL